MKKINVEITITDDIDEKYIEYAIGEYASREGWNNATYCHKCQKEMNYNYLNDNEREEYDNNNGDFVCSDCINDEMNEELEK